MSTLDSSTEKNPAGESKLGSVVGSAASANGLEALELLFENLLHSTQVHTLFLDPQLRIRRFTPRMGELFGLTQHDLGRSIEEFQHRMLYPELMNELRNVLDLGRVHEAEIQDGDNHWFLMRILPYLSEKGNEGVVLTLTDINVTRRAQMNLNRVIDFFPNAVVAINEQGLIQIVNQRTKSIFGYEAAEMIGQPVEMLLPERCWDKHRIDRMQYALHPQTREMSRLGEMFGRRKSGEEFPVEVGLNSINTEKGLLMLASVNDVTIRMATEKELLRREQELRLVINSVPMLIAYIDRDRVYRYVNNSYCAKMGLSPDRVHNRRVQDIVDEETWNQKCRHLDRVFAGESVTAELSRGFPINSTNEQAWILARYVPDRDENGQVRGCFVAMSDITELKELLEVKQRQVEHRDLFLATLSHELRNPLGAVMSALRLLQGNQNNSEVQTKTLAAIDRQAVQMTALLEDLLNVARITKGKIDLNRSPVRLDGIVKESVESVSASFEKREQRVHIVLGDRTAWVNGDAVRLRQIVSNLLTNASRYSPRGESILIRLEVSPSTDSASLGAAAIHVVDHGFGVPKEMQERIFEPFEQLRRTHNEASEGLGLGLSLSRRLAELHGGTVTVFSQGEGLGSTFTIQLPLIAPPVPHEELSQTRQRLAVAESSMIVLVEDNDDARELLRELLEYEKYDVRTASDGPSGLELIRQTRPCVALIDVGLPGMTGHEVARNIRRDGLTTTLIAVTGYGQKSDRDAALSAGFDNHITKPVDFDKLLRLIERIVSSCQESSANSKIAGGENVESIP